MPLNSPTQSPPQTDQLCVLIVEKEATTFQALADILASERAVCRFCSDLKEVLPEAERMRPDVILLNPDIPGDHLADFFRALHENSETKRTPVLVISSLRDAETRRRAFRAGASDFIIKPIEAVELISRVRRHSKLHRYELAQEALNERLEEAVQERTHELEHANIELRELNERIKAIDRSKSLVLRSIAHELRTPANGFFGVTELILEDFQEQIDTELLEALKTSEDRLRELMDDASLLVALRSEHDDEDLCPEGLKYHIESIIVEANVSAELETIFEEENFEVQVSCQLFPLALKKLLAVGDGFAVENRMLLNVAGLGSVLRLRVEVPGAQLPEDKLAVFFDDFVIEEADVPRGNLGLQPAVAYEAVMGMGGELTAVKTETGIRFEMMVQNKA